MENGDSLIKSQRVVPSSTSLNKQNPRKFFSHFLFKALIATVFLIIIPLCPCQAPEFINQTIFTRSWELLHLIFVGIAVSYGLFSRRNDDSGAENNSKFENAQSDESRLLHIPSVFDEGVDCPSGTDESKVQAWSSQYHINEPMVVVAEGDFVLNEKGNSSSGVGEKPLLLPVRSLKTRVSDGNIDEFVSEDDSGVPRSLSRSSSSLISREFSMKSSNGSLKSRVVDAADFGLANGDTGVSGSFSGCNPGSLSEEFSKKTRDGSLKYRVVDANDSRYVNRDDGAVRPSISRSNSNSSSRCFATNSHKKSMNREFGVVEGEGVEERDDENVVLLSPIPWGSRSGRMQMEEDLFRSQSSSSSSSDSQGRSPRAEEILPWNQKQELR